jgi:RNA 2',3'-cyclic 3'-phosphodiesterase
VRLFVAAYPPAAALDDLAVRIDDLRVGKAAASGVNARLAARPLWHLTVAFLGDVNEERRDATVAAVDRAAVESDALPTLRLAGGGTFGRGNFTTMWVGLAGDVAGLQSLAGTVRAKLRRAHVHYDRKPFRPHLTIARPGQRLPRDQIDADIEALATYAGPTWPLTELILVESHQGPHPTHVPLHRAPLTG